MPSRPVVVIGGDPAALLVAGRLALDGHEVVLWESPPLAGPVAVSCERPSIRVSGAGGDGHARLAAVTSDPFEALAAGDVLLTCAPPHAQEVLTGLVLPLVEPKHTLVLLSGGLSSLAHAKWLRDRGRVDLPTLVTSDTAPFFGQAAPPGHACVSAFATEPGFGVFPSCRTEAALSVLRDLFPTAKAHAHVMAAGLAAVEQFLLAPVLLMNLGAIEGRQSGFTPFDDGFSPSIARVAEALDVERLALAGALGLDLPTAAETLHAWGLSPSGDLWSAVNGSFALTRPSHAALAEAGRLADSVAFGLRSWVELADLLSVPAPLARSLVALYDAGRGAASRDGGWSLDDLGVAGMSAASLQRFLTTGNDETQA